MSLEIEPANVTLDYTGAPLSQVYTAYGTYEDGTRAPVADAAFGLDVDGARLGAFTDATFEVNGASAGKGVVFASLGEANASTGVIVNMKITTLGPGVPGNAADLFPDNAPTGPLKGIG